MISFKAKVIQGQGRGKQIGFPTANLDKTDLDIKFGVYLVEVEVDNKKYQGLLHFGPKKTFNEKVSLEVHIKNFNFNIYHKNVIISIIKKIRNIHKFNNINELKKQITSDLNFL